MLKFLLNTKIQSILFIFNIRHLLAMATAALMLLNKHFISTGLLRTLFINLNILCYLSWYRPCDPILVSGYIRFQLFNAAL